MVIVNDTEIYETAEEAVIANMQGKGAVRLKSYTEALKLVNKPACFKGDTKWSTVFAIPTYVTPKSSCRNRSYGVLVYPSVYAQPVLASILEEEKDYFTNFFKANIAFCVENGLYL